MCVNRRKWGCWGRQRGFSLLELMVVVFIIGLVSGLALIHWPAITDSSVSTEDTIRRQILEAREYALMSGRPVSLSMTTDSYHFSEYRGGTWQPIQGSVFSGGGHSVTARWSAMRGGRLLTLHATQPTIVSVTTGLERWTELEARALTTDGPTTIVLGE